MICQQCKIRPKKSIHLNTKYCLICEKHNLRKPKGTMTASQIREAKSLIGTMDRIDIAKKLGVSLSNLKRSIPGVRFAFHNKWFLNQDYVKKVCAYYEKYGKTKTQEKFPDANIRSIVERYKYFNPRQTKLSDDQFIEIAKMGGLISLDAQAKYFNRPRANAGSIKSLMYKRFGRGLVNLNGLHFNKARHLCKIVFKDHRPVELKCPHIITKYWALNGLKNKGCAKLFLWVDLEKNIKEEHPQFLKDGITAMAYFQRWIWKSNNPRPLILKMIKDREL